MPQISFTHPPAKAIAYLKAKYRELSFDYDEIMHEAHHKAFTVAKVTRVDLLSDIQNSLVKARGEGVPFEQWKKEIKPTLLKKGWYGKTEVTNPKTGETKEIFVGSRRLRTIFYTNTRVAYNVGRWQHQDQLTDAPYLRYVAILDNRNRPTHAKNHGIIRHKDDPFWQTNYPPNGWNCRCRVQAYSMERIKRRGWSDKLTAPTTNVADKDWAYDVRSGSRKSLEEYATQKYPNILDGKEREVRQAQLDEMIEEVIIKENKKYPINFIDVGSFALHVVEFLKASLDKDVLTMGIVLEKNRLLHASPKRKQSYNQALDAEELGQIVNVLEEANDVYIDMDKKNIVYTFEDKNDKEKVNKIVVEVDYNVKKFARTNAIITMSKVNRSNLKEKHMKKIEK